MSDSDMPGPVADAENKLYNIEYDPEERWIHARMRGFWEIANSHEFTAHLRTFILASRKRFGSVRLLMDRRGAPVQSPEVAAFIKETTAVLFGPNDYVAVVLDSGLNQMQIRRVASHEGMRVFGELGEAEAWLREHR